MFTLLVDETCVLVVNKNVLLIDSVLQGLEKKDFSIDKEQLSVIVDSIIKKKQDIHNALSKKFVCNDYTKELKGVTWSVKTLLSTKNENEIYQERYCDLDLIINKDTKKHLTLTLMKNDVFSLHRELNNIKNNLQRIHNSVNKN